MFFNLCFLPENFRFLEVKFSIYLNRRVFVMHRYSLTEPMCTADYIDEYKRPGLDCARAEQTDLNLLCSQVS